MADRELVEQGADEILRGSQSEDIALLVVGDPFGATTHTDLVLRAREKGIPFQVVHNASILNAVGCCGLQLYSFGETVSIPYWTETWQPDSFFDKIVDNYRRNLHTLCLLGNLPLTNKRTRKETFFHMFIYRYKSKRTNAGKSDEKEKRIHASQVYVGGGGLATAYRDHKKA